jgi:hypothetical protein
MKLAKRILNYFAPLFVPELYRSMILSSGERPRHIKMVQNSQNMEDWVMPTCVFLFKKGMEVTIILLNWVSISREYTVTFIVRNMVTYGNRIIQWINYFLNMTANNIYN